MLILSCSAATVTYRASAQYKAPDNENQPPRLIADGVAALDRGDTTTAKALFRRALILDSKNIAARTYLGILADHAGELDEAERQFGAAVAAAPNSPEAHNNYGAILLKLGHNRRAATEFEASLHLEGRQAGALANLAQIRFQSATLDGLRQAKDLFQRAHAIAPDAETARALVVVALRLHEPTQAASNYADYARRLEGAPQLVTATAARAELGAALLEAGLAMEAAHELEASLQTDPSNVNCVVLLARAQQARRDLPAAGRVLESAVARGVEAAPVYFALAEVNEARGRVEHAIPAMRRAVQLDPKNEAYHFRYAMLLTDADAPQAAVIRLKETLQEFPKSSKLWFAMGVAQFQDNKSEEAVRAFEHCVQLDPRMSPAYAYLGMIGVDQGKIQDAVAFYKKALAAEERSAVTHFLMSKALEKSTPPDDAGAGQHLKRALAIDPGFQDARLALGKFLLRTNRLTDAVKELEGVVQTDPKLAEAYYHLGRAYMRLKRKEDAQATMAKFEKLSKAEKEKSESERREILRRLADVRF